MKRYVRANNTDNYILLLDILVCQEHLSIECDEQLYDVVSSAEFEDFELDILTACEIRGYELHDEHTSSSSNSKYYIYIKKTDTGKLRVLVNLRVSNHHAKDRIIKGKFIREKELRRKYTAKIAKEIAEKEFNQKSGYSNRQINVIIDGSIFCNYEDALRAIEYKLDEFNRTSSAIEEGQGNE